MISQKVLACFPSDFQSFFLMISKSAGSIMRTCFRKKVVRMYERPYISSKLFTFAVEIRHFENFYCASKKRVGTLADDIYLQSVKLEKILLSNMEDIYVFCYRSICYIFAISAIFRFAKILFLLSVFVFS